MKCRRKVVDLEAVEFTGSDDSYENVCSFFGKRLEWFGNDALYIPTLEGFELLYTGQFLVKKAGTSPAEVLSSKVVSKKEFDFIYEVVTK